MCGVWWFAGVGTSATPFDCCTSDKEARLTVIHGDVLKTELPYFDVCVANVPYNVCHDSREGVPPVRC